MIDKDTLLEVRNLKMHFPFSEGAFWNRTQGNIYAVDGVSFTLKKGETLGLVGESGCGKSTVARAIAQLYKPTSGEVIFRGMDLTKMSKKDLLEQRQYMQMVFSGSLCVLKSADDRRRHYRRADAHISVKGFDELYEKGSA